MLHGSKALHRLLIGYQLMITMMRPITAVKVKTPANIKSNMVCYQVRVARLWMGCIGVEPLRRSGRRKAWSRRRHSTASALVVVCSCQILALTGQS